MTIFFYYLVWWSGVLNMSSTFSLEDWTQGFVHTKHVFNHCYIPGSCSWFLTSKDNKITTLQTGLMFFILHMTFSMVQSTSQMFLNLVLFLSLSLKIWVGKRHWKHSETNPDKLLWDCEQFLLSWLMGETNIDKLLWDCEHFSFLD